MATIRNPIEWSIDQLGAASHHAASVDRMVHGTMVAEPDIRRIGTADLRHALAAGMEDFKACRTDVIFIAVVYPVAGAVLIWAFFNYQLLHLLFPLASGFALLGPVAAVGLYEISRERERGGEVNWSHAIGVFASPSFGAVLLLGLGLFGIYILWMLAASAIWSAVFGEAVPESIAAFANQMLFTGTGWAVIVIGCAVGFVFALIVLAASVVSFPLLLDRPVGLRHAVTTSFRVTAKNPRTVLTWGAIVAASLVIGTIPLFLGLIVVMPVLGHATWHLYRAVIVPPEGAVQKTG